jgi:hypothetical protein
MATAMEKRDAELGLYATDRMVDFCDHRHGIDLDPDLRI